MRSRGGDRDEPGGSGAGQGAGRTNKSPWSRAGLFAGALLLSLTVAEILVRALPDSTLGYRYDAEAGRFAPPREFQYNLSPNRLGFHDVEHGPRRPDSIRILLLGDSYVESYSVPPAEVLGQRLEHYLNAAGQGSFEVISMGRSNWGQREELDALRDYGAGVDPDIVLSLFLPLNDVQNNSLELRKATKRQHLDPQVLFRPGQTRRSAETMPFLFLRASALNQLVSHRVASGSLRRGGDRPESIPIDYLVYSTRPDAVWEAAWRETESLIVETRNRANGLGAAYALAVASTPQGVIGSEEGLAVLLDSYPAMRAGAWDLDLPARRLAEIATRNQIPLLGLEPRFRDETRNGNVLHWPYDGHWNPAGNELAGALLSEFVLGMLEGDAQ
jgi:hypothetical protein